MSVVCSIHKSDMSSDVQSSLVIYEIDWAKPFKSCRVKSSVQMLTQVFFKNRYLSTRAEVCLKLHFNYIKSNSSTNNVDILFWANFCVTVTSIEKRIFLIIYEVLSFL